MPSSSGTFPASAVFGVQFSPGQSPVFHQGLRQDLQVKLATIDPNMARSGWTGLLPQSPTDPTGYPIDLSQQPAWINTNLLTANGVKGKVMPTAAGIEFDYCWIGDPNDPSQGEIICYGRYPVVDPITEKLITAETTQQGVTYVSPIILTFAAVVEYV